MGGGKEKKSKSKKPKEVKPPKAPEPPPMPAAPAPPPTPQEAGDNIDAEERRKARTATGLESTILTSGLGDVSAANVGKKTLLGG